MAWKYLKPNDAEWKPQNVLCVDTETSRTCPSGRVGEYVEEFRLGAAKCLRLRRGKYRPNGQLFFRDTRRFWDFVDNVAESKSVLWLFAHNVGFDSRTLGFWQQLDSGRYTRTQARDRSKGSASGKRQSEYATGLLVTTDPPTIVEFWTKSGAKVRMIDSLNYFQSPLSEIGRWVGLEKLSMPEPWAGEEEWMRYCERDVEILERAITKYVGWVRENRLGVFSMTLPSQAMHGFRHTEACRKIVIHDERDVQQLESEAYLGGEVLCGYIGEVRTGPGTKQLGIGEKCDPLDPPATRQVHQLDANSLFPSVMRDNLFPRKLLEWRMEGDAKRSLVSSMGMDCIAECLINTESHPIYARRKGRSGRFTGQFVAVLCGPELVAARDAGAIVAVRRFARYELADLFSSWVERWWTLRWASQLAEDEFSSVLAKRIMNSLYGKFAQKRHEWEDLPGEVATERWSSWVDLDTVSGKITHYRSIAGQVQRSIEKGYHEQAFVAIASYVTAYARERMRAFRTASGNGTIYYQGIDSLYTSDVGLANLQRHNLVSRGSLGLLRHECSSDSAFFAGWGLYRFGTKWVRTAIGRGAIECSPGEFEQTNFERLSAALSHQPVEGVCTQRVRKTIAAASPVGIVSANGWVKPLPAKWGDNPSESVDSRGVYGDYLCDQSQSAVAPAVHG